MLQQANTPLTLDELIERFEDAWNACASTACPRAADFLPSAATAGFAQVATELLRVDMERRWSGQHRKTLSDYLAEYPQLAGDRASLSALAFEEFQLRLAQKEAPSAEACARKYGIDTSQWPQLDEQDTQALRLWNESTIDMLADEQCQFGLTWCATVRARRQICVGSTDGRSKRTRATPGSCGSVAAADGAGRNRVKTTKPGIMDMQKGGAAARQRFGAPIASLQGLR
jgi:hypothetical protein